MFRTKQGGILRRFKQSAAFLFAAQTERQIRIFLKYRFDVYRNRIKFFSSFFCFYRQHSLNLLALFSPIHLFRIILFRDGERRRFRRTNFIFISEHEKQSINGIIYGTSSLMYAIKHFCVDLVKFKRGESERFVFLPSLIDSGSVCISKAVK